MAGDLIQTYTTKITEGQKGYMAISLSEWTTTNLPVITEGSRVNIGGALYEFAGDEAIDSTAQWAGIGASTQVYGYFVIGGGGATVTSVLTTSSPTWDDEAQEWRDTATSTYRFWGGIYKDSGGNYADKFIYEGRSLKHSYNFIIDERGNLDMDGNISLVGSANADKQIDFASDASIAWDESEDEFNINKRTVIKSIDATRYAATGKTENQIFDALSTACNSTGKYVQLTGGGEFSSNVAGADQFDDIIIVGAVKTAANTIDLEYFNINDGQCDNYTLTNGDATIIFDLAHTAYIFI